MADVDKPGASLSAVRTLEREGGYWSAKAGRRFMVTHQTAGSGVTTQTSYVSTTPSFILYNPTSSRRWMPEQIRLRQQGTVAGAVIGLVIKIDPTNRWASGGTAILGQNTNTDMAISNAAAVAKVIFKTGATASAEGTGDSLPRTIHNEVLEPIITTPNNLIEINFKHGLWLGRTSSLLVYAYAATTAPTLGFQFTWVEQE